MTPTSKGEAGEAKIEILKTYYACAHALFNKRQFGLSKIKSLQTGLTSLTSLTLINKKTLITIFIRNHSQLLFAFAHQHVVVVEKNHWQNRTIYESKLHHFRVKTAPLLG